MYKYLFILLLALVGCQSNEPTNHNVFPNVENIPTQVPYATGEIYCIDNKAEFIRVEFNGEIYIAYDSNGNIASYPITAKVEIKPCN